MAAITYTRGRRGGPEADAPAEDIAKSHVTFVNVLKKAGYATALSGKWQLSGKLPGLIRECDFDEYCMWAYEHNLPEGVKHTGGLENDKKPSRYWHPSIIRNGEYVPTRAEEYGPDIFNNFVLDFIGRNKDRPFFVYYPMCLTHAPHVPTPLSWKEGMDKYKNSKDNFKPAVEYVDVLIGRLENGSMNWACGRTRSSFSRATTAPAARARQPTELGARVPDSQRAGYRQTARRHPGTHGSSDILPTRRSSRARNRPPTGP